MQQMQHRLGMVLGPAARLVLLQANCLQGNRIKQAPVGVLGRARKASRRASLLCAEPLRLPLLALSPPLVTQHHSHHLLQQRQQQQVTEVRQVIQATQQQV
jgi:hypothetical protein